MDKDTFMAEEAENLTIPEVARWLRVSEDTVRIMITDGRLHAFRAGRRNYRIPRTAVERLIGGEQGEQQSSPEQQGEHGSK